MLHFNHLIHSLTFRVNVILLILLALLGWGFTQVFAAVCQDSLDEHAMMICYGLIFIHFVIMAGVIMTITRWLLHSLTKMADARDGRMSIERDIAIAANIQNGMLPRSFEKRKDIDIYGMQNPAKTVGGDLYDYFIRRSYTDEGGSDYLFFIIGDVSGKGVPAALIMSVVCHLFRNVSRRSTDAARIAGSINASLTERNEENMFCTAFVGVLDLTTGQLDYCNAGHNAPIIIRNGKKAEHLHSKKIQLPLGVDSMILYTSETIYLKKDDMMFLYTDGVSEAENADKQFFGDDATFRAVQEASNSESMEMLVTNVIGKLRTFVQSTEQSDDITMLALKRLVPDPTKIRSVTEELEREYESEQKKAPQPC